VTLSSDKGEDPVSFFMGVDRVRSRGYRRLPAACAGFDQVERGFKKCVITAERIGNVAPQPVAEQPDLARGTWIAPQKFMPLRSLHHEDEIGPVHHRRSQ